MPRKKANDNAQEFHNDRVFSEAKTEETKELQMSILAMDLVEWRLRNGTASSQETTHFLKLASTRARLESEKLESENELLKAKTQSIQESKSLENLYREALDAFKDYSGRGGQEDDRVN